MNIFSIFLFVFSASIDIFIVALAYGVKNIKINFSSNLVIATISALGTFISMKIGLLLISFISIKYANFLGSLILFLIGIYFLIDYFKEKHINLPQNCSNTSPICILEKPEIADIDKSGNIELKESFLLSIALSLNNFGLGIGASIVGLDILFTTLITFFFSIIILPIGFYFSKKLSSKLIGNKGSLISALIIIFLALISVF
ncbi:sporulation membrane protein YtaF [Clostridium tarantellae]|uniref:Sporulation membrane protein YtaF n=1 Tax=Clostridium tarantellae TaxID=39493 RepID=A0A6I1MGL5_9CLOT|nr:sporulation membrane protein YtaF [Clostridium tarantellae]